MRLPQKTRKISRSRICVTKKKLANFLHFFREKNAKSGQLNLVRYRIRSRSVDQRCATRCAEFVIFRLRQAGSGPTRSRAEAGSGRARLGLLSSQDEAGLGLSAWGGTPVARHCTAGGQESSEKKRLNRTWKFHFATKISISVQRDHGKPEYSEIA